MTFQSTITLLLALVAVAMSVTAYSLFAISREVRAFRLGKLRKPFGAWLEASTAAAKVRQNEQSLIEEHTESLNALAHMAAFGAKKAAKLEEQRSQQAPPPPPAPVASGQTDVLDMVQNTIQAAAEARKNAPPPPPPSDGTGN